jgi:hypothetical protein
MLAPLEIPPGLFRNGTQYQVRGRWYMGDRVRWVNGRMRPVGGWQRITTSALTGKGREILSWGDNSADRWIAVGTSSKLYASHGDSTFYDVTPAAFVTGLDDATESFGYGGGNYGAGTYGTPRSGGTYIPMALWQFDNWGQNLVACARQDGKIYEWGLATGTPAAQITNSPADCVGLVVSDQRHIIALGAENNGRRVKWCDKENNTVWTPASTNEAGFLDLQTQSNILAGVRAVGQILVLTQTDAHAMRYIGQPFIYSRERVGAECGLLSPGALISVESAAYWMGNGQFWAFDGSRVQELPCDVADYVFGSMNKIQIEKTVAGHNPKFGEVWWHYPSNGSNEPDRYVFYNYREGFWSLGTMARTSWDAGSIFGYPYAMGTDNHLYRHEDDWTDNGASMFASIYAETGVIEIGDGERTAHVNQVITDEETQGDLTLSFKTRFTPSGAEYNYGPYSVRADGYTDIRLSGRQLTMRVVPTVDEDWSLGRLRGDITLGGRR